MAKQAAPKPESKKSGRNDTRKNGKASKKNPKAPNAGATGRTIGGYTPVSLARREARRATVTLAGLSTPKNRS